MLKRVLKFEKLRPEARVPVRPSEKKRAANLKRALYNHREKRAAEKKKNERL